MAVEGRDIYIHRKGRRVGREINLLMVSEDGTRHYTAIKSLSRLLSSKNSNTKRKQHFCMNCLQGFTQELSRDQQQAYCENNESVRVEIPKQGSSVEFKDGQNQFRVPYIMYADFESILEPMALWNRDLPINLIPMKLINTRHLVGMFKEPIEAKIALKRFVITSKEKLVDCITCFPSYLWVL